MNKTLSAFIATGFFVTLIGVSSCVHDPIDPNNNPNDTIPSDTIPAVAGLCDPDTVYFQRDILPFLGSTCAMDGCHSAASANNGVILDSYSNVFNTTEVKPGNIGGSDLYEVITDSDLSKRMPPSLANALSSDQIELIKKWIEQGAKNLTCIEDDCDTLNVTLSVTVNPILAASCNGCHNSSAASGGVIIETYVGLKAVVDNGKLLNSIKHLTGASPMPQNLPKLDDCKISKIEAWINAGALNN